MRIDLPELTTILPLILEVESRFEGPPKKISAWVEENRQDIERNRRLVAVQDGSKDIEILLQFLRNLLVRAMKGEAGEQTYREIKAAIKDKSHLKREVYAAALKKANYRWGSDAGADIIVQVVAYFEDELNWDWRLYHKLAEIHRDNNFYDDRLRSIKHIGFKVRDLALSCFDPWYAAFDLHVARVPTRIGLLNYGYDLLGDPRIEMGNNPSDEKNYLFLHRLFRKFSVMTDNNYMPADLDRMFWHLGRAYCKAHPECEVCPIRPHCLTGQATRTSQKPARARTTPYPPSGTGHRIQLPYGGPGASFTVDDLLAYLHTTGRDFIIIGGANCVYDRHTKPNSLDYWLRTHCTPCRNVRQAVGTVVEALIATELFEVREKLRCPDSKELCKGLVLSDAARRISLENGSRE